MSSQDAPQVQSRLVWVASRWKALAVIAVVVLVVLLHVVVIPVRITVNITFVGEQTIHIVIDGNTVAYFDLPWHYPNGYEGHAKKSYSVGVGQHSVIVFNDGSVELQKSVVAWPFVGNSVDCLVSD